MISVKCGDALTMSTTRTEEFRCNVPSRLNLTTICRKTMLCAPLVTLRK